MTRRRVFFPALIALLALGSCRGGCRRGDDRAATVEGRLALFPVATKVVAAIDVAKLRASPAAAKLAEKAQQDQADQHEIEEFARRTGFDPLRQLTSVTVAFPEEARAHGEFGVVIRAEHLDEARLVAYARDQLQKSGDDLGRPRRMGGSRSGRPRAIRRWPVSSSTPRPSCWGREAGPRGWPTWPRARAPSTAPRPTSIW